MQRENAYIIMYARINYKVVFSQAPFFRYVLYGYTLYILYTSPRKMKEYVFFIKKRTLHLQRKSVKIAEKVQRAPIFLQKGLANRPLDVVTLQLEKSLTPDPKAYPIPP